MNMDLPGLRSTTNTSSDEPGTVTVKLQGQSEWRYEVPFGSQLMIKLVSGTAEIFGTELAVGSELTLSGQNGAVFTWTGCEFEWKGKNVSEYTSDETPMPVYANLHFALETMRRKHQQSGENDNYPSVLILGPEDSGKTSLCKILVSYANKIDRFPMYVNLDPRQGVFSTPGGLSAAPISDILDIEEGWGVTQANGPTMLHPKSPLVYYYGLEKCTANTNYYKHTISKLALGVKERIGNDKMVENSGIIIDTPGDLLADKTQGYSIIESIIAEFDVNVLAVVAQERLYSDIQKRFKAQVSSKSLQVVKVAKSGGVVELDDTFVRANQSRQIREYFYGTPQQPLAPKTITVDYSTVVVYRIAESESVGNSSVLPIGLENEEPSGTTKSNGKSEYLIKLETSAILQNCVMAMLNASPNDSPEVLIDSEVLGYVHVVDADDTRKKLKVLLPVAGRLPSRPFLIGEYRYHE